MTCKSITSKGAADNNTGHSWWFVSTSSSLPLLILYNKKVEQWSYRSLFGWMNSLVKRGAKAKDQGALKRAPARVYS